MDEYWDYLARVNAVLDRAAVELDGAVYQELLAQVEYEVLDRLDPNQEDGGDGDLDGEVGRPGGEGFG